MQSHTLCLAKKTDKDELQREPQTLNLIVKSWIYSVAQVKPFRVFVLRDNLINHIILER